MLPHSTLLIGIQRHMCDDATVLPAMLRNLHWLLYNIKRIGLVEILSGERVLIVVYIICDMIVY